MLNFENSKKCVSRGDLARASLPVPKEEATCQIQWVQAWSEFLSLFTEVWRVELKDNSIIAPKSTTYWGGKK